MIWLALALITYSFYSLFISGNGTELALSMIRFAVAIVLVATVKVQNEMMISAALLLNTIAVLVAMVIMRKEVQTKNDHF
jgi:hypothetical protein